jgi:uncharacterized SAM-dependent methyltransferase
MSYYKNTDVATKYKVSNSTVGEWIKGSRAGKNNLQVRKYRNKDRILESEHNEAEMMRLKEEGVKYRTSHAVKYTEPKKEFYDIYNENDILEILNGIKTRSRIDDKFYYFDSNLWDKVVSETQIPGLSTSNASYDNVLNNKYYVSKSGYCNLVDLGPGNGAPVTYFIDRMGPDNCRSYTSVDASEQMLALNKANITKKYPKIHYRSYQINIEQSNFSSIFLESLSEDTKNDSNIIFMTGLTMTNFGDRKSVMKNIARSMFPGDLLVFDHDLDTVANRHNFAYVKDNKREIQMLTYILSLMGIDTDQCEMSFRYDDKRSVKIGAIIPDKDYYIKFNLKGVDFTFHIEKNVEIILWWHLIASEIQVISEINSAGLKIINYTQDQSGKFGTFVCTLKTQE